MLDDFYGSIQGGLQEKLGCVLFQLPPKYAFSAERLQDLIQNMRPGFKNVVEFRHSSWWTETVYKELAKQGITFTGHSHPIGVPDEAIVNTPVAYYRFHGVPDLFYSSYKHDVLEHIADSLLKNKKAEEVYIYFNNTAAMGAIENAVWLTDYLKESGVIFEMHAQRLSE